MNHNSRIRRADESTATGVPIVTPRLVEFDVGTVVGFGTETSETSDDESVIWLREILDEGVTIVIKLELLMEDLALLEVVEVAPG